MQVTIKGTEQELLISTVSVVPDPESNELHMLRCVHCNGTVTQYQGIVAKIVPIAEPYDRPLTIQSCHRCKIRYTLQSHAKYDATYAKVVLERTEKAELNVFYCYRHEGRVLVDFTHESIHMRRGPVSIPFSTTCQQCQQQYFFSDIV